MPTRPGSACLSTVPAGKEQVWRLLDSPFPPLDFFFSLHLHLSWVYSTNCLLWMLEIVLWSYFRDTLDDLWDKEVGVCGRQRSFWGSFLGSSPVLQA